MNLWHGNGVDRLIYNNDESQLFDLAESFAQNRLATQVLHHEQQHVFPRSLLMEMGAMGLLTLPFAHMADPKVEKIPYRVSLQILEILSSAWLSLAVSLSVHHLSCAPLIKFGNQEQKERWVNWTLGGNSIGAYCLSEPQSGSDAAALETKAIREGNNYRITGTKAWITHGGVADFYILFARTGPDKSRGISCFFIPADTPGIDFGKPESKMALNSSPTAQVYFNDVIISSDHLIGREGEGFAIALSSLDVGRLGIAACAVGLAQSALNLASEYASNRVAFDQSIDNFQGVAFMLADMATSVEASRSLYVNAAAQHDVGSSISKIASMAKLLSTDSAMSVTTEAVQILGGNGYTADYNAERYMREAKVLQIVEGTNQIQRVVISRELQSRHVKGSM